MKVCTFCGLKTDDKTSNCSSCGSSDFLNVCPNCSNQFEGSFCPDCGTRYNALPAICQICGTKFYTRACPNCGAVAGTRANNAQRSDTYWSNGMNNATPNARLAFVFGLLGMFMLPIPFSIVAIVMANKEIKAGRPSPMTKGGLVLGICGVTFGVMIMLIYGFSIIAALSR